MKKFSLLLLIIFFLAGMTAGLARTAHAVTGTGNATMILPVDGSQYTLDASSQFNAFAISPTFFTFSLAGGSVVKLSSSDKRLLNNSLNIPTTCGVDSSTITITSAGSQTVTITPGAVCSGTGGTTYYVAPTGSNANPGTITQPFLTISKAQAVAQAGDTIMARAGTYREKVIVTKSNLTIQSYPGEVAIMKGSDIVSAWTQEAGKNVWSKNIPIPEANILPETIGGFIVCLPDALLCRFPYQVFIDDVKLTKVQPGTDPGPGQFTWSGTGVNLTMRIGTNPTGKLVEVSVRGQWIGAAIPQGSTSPYDLPNNVRIRGLTFRHNVRGGEGSIQPGPYRVILCAGQPRESGGDCSANTGTGWVIENNDIGWAHGMGINLQSSLHTVQNNIIHHTSNLGIAGNVQNATISSNTIRDNNNEGYNFDWEAGGLKITIAKTTTISNNTVYNNTGIGLICDIVCDGITFANNRVHHNTQGIMYEISSNGTIKDNVIYDNGGQGIWISNAASSTVTGNVSVRNLFAQIQLSQADRGAGSPDTQDNVIENNTFIGNDQNAAQQQNLKAFHTGGPNLLSTNTINNNKLFRYGSVPTLYFWINRGYDTPASLCTAIGKECLSTVLTQTQADQVLISNNIPLTPLATSQTLAPKETSTISASARAPSRLPTLPPEQLPSRTFSPGDRVQTADALRVRIAPSLRGALLGVQRRNMQATIVDGPIIANLYTWWKVNFDQGPGGWSAENWLEKIMPIPVREPAPSPMLNQASISLPRVLRKQSDTQVKPSSTPTPSLPSLPRVLRKQGDTKVRPSSTPTPSLPSLPRVLRKQSDTQVKPSSTPTPSLPSPTISASARAPSRLPTLPPEQLPSRTFSPGDRVQTADALRVRIAPSLRGALLGVQRRNMQATIVDGPIIANLYTWWKVNFDQGPDGWSAEDWLQKIATATLRTPPLRQIPLSPPAPIPARTPPPDPARVREPVPTPTPTPIRTPSQELTPLPRPREIR